MLWNSGEPLKRPPSVEVGNDADMEGESGSAAVDNLCRPTRAALYGFDWDKKTLTDPIDKHSVHISQAVSVLTDAKEPKEIVSVCKAFLRKFEVIPYEQNELNEITRATFFAGGKRTEKVEPQELKYAVLRLLGLSEPDSLKHVGAMDKSSRDRLAFSPGFEMHRKRIEERRRFYPLTHEQDFEELKTPRKNLEKALEKAHSALTVFNVFEISKIPSARSWESGSGKSESPLEKALYILGYAISGMSDSTIARELNEKTSMTASDTDVHELLTPGEACPFTSAVLTLVEEKRKEKKKPKTQATEKTG